MGQNEKLAAPAQEQKQKPPSVCFGALVDEVWEDVDPEEAGILRSRVKASAANVQQVLAQAGREDWLSDSTNFIVVVPSQCWTFRYWPQWRRSARGLGTEFDVYLGRLSDFFDKRKRLFPCQPARSGKWWRPSQSTTQEFHPTSCIALPHLDENKESLLVVVPDWASSETPPRHPPQQVFSAVAWKDTPGTVSAQAMLGLFKIQLGQRQCRHLDDPACEHWKCEVHVPPRTMHQLVEIAGNEKTVVGCRCCFFGDRGHSRRTNKAWCEVDAECKGSRPFGNHQHYDWVAATEGVSGPRSWSEVVWR